MFVSSAVSNPLDRLFSSTCSAIPNLLCSGYVTTRQTVPFSIIQCVLRERNTCVKEVCVCVQALACLDATLKLGYINEDVSQTT